MRRMLAAHVAVFVAAWLALQGSTAVAPQLLTYSVDVPLPGTQPYDGGLCIASSDGSAQMRVTAPGDARRDAAWSADGRYVVYVRVLSEESHVFVANADGGGERNLTRGYGPLNGDPTWSPDGRHVAFTAWRQQGLSQIAVAQRDGSSRRALSLGVSGNAAQPAWAPNGRQLAVIVSPNAASSPRDLYLVDIDGSGSRLLARSATEPAWSPDGSRIVYVSSGGLNVANADGSGSQVVAANASSPAWSTDGRLIAFVRNGELLVVRPEGGGERVVVSGPLPVRGPAWRPAADRTAGTKRQCLIEGTSRADVLRGTSSTEVIVGGSGADTIFAGGGQDVVLGGSGHDFVSGESGGDRLVGGFGHDRVYGGKGDDVLYARDAQSDLLDGGPGRDAAYYDPGVVGATDRLRSVEMRLGAPA